MSLDKKAQGFSVLVKLALVLITLAIFGFIFLSAVNITQDDSNETTNGNKVKLDECLNGSEVCSDVFLDTKGNAQDTNEVKT